MTLNGRVFARKEQFEKLPEEVQQNAKDLAAHMTQHKDQVFTPQTRIMAKVTGIKGKALVEYIGNYLTEKNKPAEEAEAETPATETPAEEAQSASEEKPAEGDKDTAAEGDKEKENDAPTDGEKKEGDVADAEKTEEDSKEDKTESKKEAVKEKAEQKKEVAKEKVKATKPPALSPEVEKQARQLADALVFMGFLTLGKDNEKNPQAPVPSEFVKDSEFLIPIAPEVATPSTTSVWKVLEGANLAEYVKRKAGVFAAFSAQGKDVYLVVQNEAKKIYLFESDLARAPVAEFDASNTKAMFDSAHFTHGVKLVEGDKVELLNLQEKDKQDNLLDVLTNAGVQYHEAYTADMSKVNSFYDLTDHDMEGNEVPMSKYKGKVVLVVNVSSKCGLTPKNYPELAQLDEKYREEGLQILAFPCNQFANQEPGTHEEIMEFVKQYNCEFPFFEKRDVNGANARPVFTYLKSQLPGSFGDFVKWNFTKFLVDRDGKPYKRFAPKEQPLSFEEDIKTLLAKEVTKEEVKEDTADATKEEAKEEAIKEEPKEEAVKEEPKEEVAKEEPKEEVAKEEAVKEEPKQEVETKEDATKEEPKEAAKEPTKDASEEQKEEPKAETEQK